MLVLRRAGLGDLDYLVYADAQEEGYTQTEAEAKAQAVRAGKEAANAEKEAAHRKKIHAFISDADKAAWVYEDERVLAGVILCRFRNLANEREDAPELLFYRDELPRSTFPPDGRFCEVFNLWVEPDYRRRGLATRLKKQLEIESRARGICLVYTHTEATNLHVLALNYKMGYREVRRGPIWDEVVRVSLVKRIDDIAVDQ